MEPFCKYIRDYLQSNLFSSPSINWWDLYKGNENFVRNNEFYEVGNDDFKKIVREIPHSLTRNAIFEFFEKKEDYYKGYVSSMLWGGIGLPPSKKEYMNSAFSIPKKDIEKRIENLKALLKQNNIRGAFLSMSKPYETGNDSGNMIKGIGISYFTKLLFFLGNEQMTIRPLIYDANLMKVHSALIKDDFQELNKFFTIRTFSMSASSVSINGGHFEGGKEWEPVDYYLDYIKRMNELANNNEIFPSNEEAGKQGKSGRLEEILFGSPLSKRKGENDPSKNPRAFVSDYLGLSNFAEEIRNKSTKSKKTIETNKIFIKSEDKENAENKHERKGHSTISQTSQEPRIVQNTHEIFLNKKKFSLFITKGIELTYRDVPILVYYGVDRSNGNRRLICKVSIKDEEHNIEELFRNTNVLSLLDRGRNPHYKYQVCPTETKAKNLWKDVLRELNVPSDVITSE